MGDFHPEYDGSPVVWWGHPGASAYELAVKNGFSGSMDDWLASLKGEKGDSVRGDRGDTGKTPLITIGNVSSTDEPSVKIRGTKEYPILDFELVPGKPGADGMPGAAGMPGMPGTTMGRPIPYIPGGGVEFIAGKVGAVDTCNVLLLSDSTGNDSIDWFRVWAGMEANRRANVPNLGVNYYPYNHETKSWGAPEILKPGTVIPATGGTTWDDNFSDNKTDIVGTDGYTGKPGVSSVVDGSLTINGLGDVNKDVTTADGIWTINVLAKTSPSSLTHNVRYYINRYTYAYVNVSTTGLVSVGFYVDGASVFSEYQQKGGTGEWVNLSFTLESSIQVQRFTFNGVTHEGLITQEHVSTSSIKSISGQTGDGTQIKTDSVKFVSPYMPERRVGLNLYNAGFAGGTLETYADLTMFDTMPIPDVVVINEGHNYGGTVGASFTKIYNDYLASFKAKFKDVKVIAIGQNPQYSPAVGVANQNNRMVALRTWAHSNGIDYIPIFERFLSQAGDRGRSFVSVDGVHPTTGDKNYKDGVGASLAARVFFDSIYAADFTLN